MPATELPPLESLKLSTRTTSCATFEKAQTPKFVKSFSHILFGVLTFFLVGLLFIPWQQVSTGYGRVQAYSPENRQQRIEAPITGRIKQWFVREGQTVKKGQELLQIEDIDPRIIERLNSQLQAAKDKLIAAEKALEFSKKNLIRQKKLADKGLSSQRKFELSQIEVSKHQSELSSAQASLAKVETQLARQSSQSIVAEQDGTVVRIDQPQGGVLVKAGDSLALFVPSTEEDRIVELLIPGNDLPLMKVGRKVRLQFEGWPAVQFTGWPSVAVGTFGGVVRFVDAVDDGNGNYRVIVFPDPDDIDWPKGNYLRQGVRAIGWVLLDTVPLGWELWRRLNGFPPTVTPDNEKTGLSSSELVK